MSFGYNDNVASRVHRPDNCFRITVDDTLERDYFSSYTVEMDAGIIPGWGAFTFKDLTCEPMSYEAAAQADVCAMFGEEVGRLEMPSAKPVVHVPSADATDPSTRTLIANTLAGFQLGFYSPGADAVAAVAAVTANRHQFTAMWYVTNAKKETMNDLHRDYETKDSRCQG